jgi:hypothetical protein
MFFHRDTSFFDHFFQLGHASVLVILYGLEGGVLRTKKTTKKYRLDRQGRSNGYPFDYDSLC